MDVELIVQLIQGHRYQFCDERELQEGLAAVLGPVMPGLTREHVASPHDRLDFLLPGGVGIEVKVDGSLAAVTRQLHRYAQRDEITALLVVTSRRRHARLPDVLNGKPVRVVVVGGL